MREDTEREWTKKDREIDKLLSHNPSLLAQMAVRLLNDLSLS